MQSNLERGGGGERGRVRLQEGEEREREGGQRKIGGERKPQCGPQTAQRHVLHAAHKDVHTTPHTWPKVCGHHKITSTRVC